MLNTLNIIPFYRKKRTSGQWLIGWLKQLKGTNRDWLARTLFIQNELPLTVILNIYYMLY